jgi:hypothetical protein
MRGDGIKDNKLLPHKPKQKPPCPVCAPDKAAIHAHDVPRQGSVMLELRITPFLASRREKVLEIKRKKRVFSV